MHFSLEPTYDLLDSYNSTITPGTLYPLPFHASIGPGIGLNLGTCSSTMSVPLLAPPLGWLYCSSAIALFAIPRSPISKWHRIHASLSAFSGPTNSNIGPELTAIRNAPAKLQNLQNSHIVCARPHPASRRVLLFLARPSSVNI